MSQHLKTQAPRFDILAATVGTMYDHPEGQDANRTNTPKPDTQDPSTLNPNLIHISLQPQLSYPRKSPATPTTGRAGAR